MMGNHDTGRDRSQEGRTERKGHITNGIKASRGGFDGASCSNTVGLRSES